MPITLTVNCSTLRMCIMSDALPHQNSRRQPRREHGVGQVLGRDDVGCGGTDVAGADDGYLGHVIALAR